MKNRYFTIAVFSTLLGVYSASVYQFSVEKMTTGGVIERELPAALSVESQEADKRRILDVVRLQEYVTIDSNIPVPGAECEFSMDEVRFDDEEFNRTLSECLERNKE